MTTPGWNGHGQTDVGMVRSENQDSFACLNTCGIWCVADGMGGHKEGSIASHLITQSLESLEALEFRSFSELLNKAQLVLDEANNALCDMSKSFYVDDVIGTTVIALLIHEEQAAVLWAGDSRLYRMRGNSFELITRDHTQYEVLVNQGVISTDTPEGTHPASHVLTRALGVNTHTSVELKYLDLDIGDRFLLCSDGLSNMIEQLELGKTLYYSEDKQRAVANLVNMALARQANDNVTALIVDRE
ncbi:PP2C family protein-serine/threonine phosphatase [Marinobacterium stanieri]|uniref:PP2C family protein-serine/threonine phosphatase n=1 Tax=Marinobacterium stanieri TaxID=49186 RepID=UPI0004960ACC|nr:PP2C family serine/threonine-protein phosphatase [Marinobacterium stanieri]